ncbi:hypothetical protein B0I72DRAFT_162195 [Yarrowia lipolytica]|uniref:YALI0F31581p n=2 Tax=Yarrowia lipolytica TaxID=4952 RepID=Q6BZR0_YARLI|nr:YALI0F31581p [Yarrowia lipolytica CLIB122]AOW07965.1 hypothetical protein YALI1_F39199g [Yarrowia lipolytica]KAB8282353.1 hypothetical protein BKA91DRAFT_162851 [Yarrowia lipolytica]KAE8172261.1 hypothetical protein BKA90DRAFT_157336 [Yarrowia lipolytica]KAJ8055002.1 hypothetical protein LXG23DRAFT_47072 [Yarrowia lipolytica]RDW23946.1 hypothetical protein B0I71DRAFT_168409 [Yarrowia lipolytica]|eukprot:XP_506102.1 YALI0F31581p [Yarrowia lipolytica CLIB122]
MDPTYPIVSYISISALTVTPECLLHATGRHKEQMWKNNTPEVALARSKQEGNSQAASTPYNYVAIVLFCPMTFVDPRSRALNNLTGPVFVAWRRKSLKGCKAIYNQKSAPGSAVIRKHSQETQMLDICDADKQQLVTSVIEQCNRESNASAFGDRLHYWLTGEELKPFVPEKNVGLLANEPSSDRQEYAPRESAIEWDSGLSSLNPVDAVEMMGYGVYFIGWLLLGQ